MIAVVGYGRGNVNSVLNALVRVQAEFALVEDPRQLGNYDKVLLPGVGAFGDCMATLRQSGFIEPLKAHVESGKTLLGICVGMQMLAEEGTEFGSHPGLGFVKGRVVQIDRKTANLRLPHVGWNAIRVKKECPLLQGLPDEKSCYFVHSYHVLPDDAAVISADVEYGGNVTAALSAPPLYGTQFHPEKSQQVGLKILENFSRL